MKPTKSIYILLSLLLISNCGDKVREEITERYEDGNKKTIMKFKGSGSEEVMVEKIGYSQSGDTLFWENLLEKMKRVKRYYKNGQIKYEWNFKDGEYDGKSFSYYKNGQIHSEENYIDGKFNGNMMFYYKNGQIKEERNFKDGMEDGKMTYYNEDGSIKEVRNYKDGKLVK